jgi:protein YIPF1/2
LADGDGYDLNTSYVPPSFADADDADAVVPAIGGAAAAGTTPAAAAAATASTAAAPAAAPALAFAPSTASAAPVSGTIRPAAAAAPPAGGGGGFGGGGGPPRPPAASGNPADPEDPSKAPFWSPRRYRPYFDVDTSQVLDRVAHSFLGPFRPSFMAATADAPDLYGPFWVATTLVLVTAVAGNYADYLSFSRWAAGGGGAGAGADKAAGGSAAPAPPPGNGTAAAGGPPPEIPDPTGRSDGSSSVSELQWYNDYAKVSYSALLFYGYVFALGFGLWFALRWFRSEMRLANVWCVYGYAMTAFVPAAFLCIFPAGWARSLVVALATASSGLFLVANLKAAIFEAAPARATALLAGVVCAHAGVGLALRMYFFSFSSKRDFLAGGGGGGA